MRRRTFGSTSLSVNLRRRIAAVMPRDYDPAVRPPSSTPELVETKHMMIGNSSEDVGEPCLRIDVVELRGLNERVHQRRDYPEFRVGAGW